MNLLIVESPGKLKKISSFLPDGWQVAASVGHVRDLPLKSVGVGPPDFVPRYVNTERGEQVLANLARLAGDAEEIYLATDPDREGEAIAWHLAEALGLRDPKRITYTEITETAVRKALGSPRPIDQNLVRAQEGRRVLDRLYGYGVSPAVSEASGQQLSAGRVQSPAVRLVVERERQIRAFSSAQHYAVDLFFGARKGAPGSWKAVLNARPLLPPGEELFRDRAAAETLAAVKELAVRSYSQGETRQSPPPPFITSTLQQAAFNALKLDAKAAMDCAQKLYEAGHITYMRTDSPAMSEEATADIRKLAANKGWPLPDKPRVFKGREGAQEAHEAIRPVHAGLETAGETDSERALYRLIRMRAIASQLADAVYSTVRAVLEVRATLPPWRVPPPRAGRPAPGGLFAGNAGSPAGGQGDAGSPAGGQGDGGSPAGGQGDGCSPVGGQGNGADGRQESDARNSPAFDPNSPREVTATFEAKGRRLVAPGWKTLTPADQAQDEKEDPELDNPVPPLAQGERVSPLQSEVRTRRTQAPSRYTQASLVRELERRGIGRPSTYASIMDNIAVRGYVQENRRRQLEATGTGEELTGLMEGAFGFLEYGFTRALEERLDGIAEGRAEYLPTVRDAYASLQQELRGFRRGLAANGRLPACPACGEALSRMLRESGPDGPGWDYWKCRNPACGSSFEDSGGAPDPATRRSSLLTDYLCPDCGSPLRHLTRAGSPRNGGYNFWRCSKDDCMTTIDDRDGKPDCPAPESGGDFICPECGSAVRRLYRTGAGGARACFWKCASDACGLIWNDKDGGPDWQAWRKMKLTEEKCPNCGGFLKHYLKEPFPGAPNGYDYWACQDRVCRSYFPDQEGRPDFETRYRAAPSSGHFCACCGEPVKQARKAVPGGRSQTRWKCQDEACGAVFADAGGAPDQDAMWVPRLTEKSCPLCGSPLVSIDAGAAGKRWECSAPACPGRWEDQAGAPAFGADAGSGADTAGGAQDGLQDARTDDDGAWTQEAADEDPGEPAPPRSCPVCGGPLRHVFRAGPTPADSYNYWRCQNDTDCGSSFDDRGGAPDPSTRRVSVISGFVCPECGAVMKHNMREPDPDGAGGWNFWSCSSRSCTKRFHDRAGQPDFGAPFFGVPEAGQACPTCGGPIRHLKRVGADAASSWNYWKCLDPTCGSAFDDRNGAPDPATARRTVETDFKCPDCGRNLRHSMKAPGPDGTGGWDFWACADRTCGRRLNDMNGEPDFHGAFTGGGSEPAQICPHCGGAVRHHVKAGASREDSWNYWRCLDRNCGSAYDDLNGAPDPSTRRVTLDTLESCPRCGEPLRRHTREPAEDGPGGYDFWACTGRSCRARFDDLDGKPDADGTRAAGRDLTDVPCPRCASPLKHLVRVGPDARSSWNYWKCSDPGCGSNYDDLDGAPDPASRRSAHDSEFECQACGAKLRHHVKDPGPDGTGGWNFWACPNRNCRTRYADGDGGPDFASGPAAAQTGQTDVPCPACGSHLRHLERKGSGTGDSYNYWKCPDPNCGSSFDDRDGAPDPATRRVSVISDHTCPICGKNVRHSVKEQGEDGARGWNFWACSDRSCPGRWNDLDGAPDFDSKGSGAAPRDLTDVDCPACGGKLRHLVKDGGSGGDSWNYWKCPEPDCGSSYEDRDGAPDPATRRVSVIIELPCPICGKSVRHSVKEPGPDGARGWNFWACSDRSCPGRWNDLDGQPDFDSKGGGTARDLTDVDCPACGGKLR
ncbi:MAG: hypothetical protein LBT40_10035, partial [Deltaproteobacteria bacterium]|nr:hypothetical protein [Deltaproteobacteria bacterium]